MNHRLKDNLKKMTKLVKRKCKDCKDNYECCDEYFCMVTEAGLNNMGIAMPKTENKLFYLGPNGCVVPPKYRIVCTSFICKGVLDQDDEFRKRWNKLNDAIKSDKEAQEIVTKDSPDILSGLRSIVGGFK